MDQLDTIFTEVVDNSFVVIYINTMKTTFGFDSTKVSNHILKHINIKDGNKAVDTGHGNWGFTASATTTRA